MLNSNQGLKNCMLKSLKELLQALFSIYVKIISNANFLPWVSNQRSNIKRLKGMSFAISNVLDYKWLHYISFEE